MGLGRDTFFSFRSSLSSSLQGDSLGRFAARIIMHGDNGMKTAGVRSYSSTAETRQEASLRSGLQPVEGIEQTRNHDLKRAPPFFFVLYLFVFFIFLSCYRIRF